LCFVLPVLPITLVGEEEEEKGQDEPQRDGRLEAASFAFISM